MTNVVSILTSRASASRRRMLGAFQVALLAAAIVGGILLHARTVESCSELAAPPRAVATAPALRDQSLPDATEALSGADREPEAPMPTF